MALTETVVTSETRLFYFQTSPFSQPCVLLFQSLDSDRTRCFPWLRQSSGGCSNSHQCSTPSQDQRAKCFVCVVPRVVLSRTVVCHTLHGLLGWWPLRDLLGRVTRPESLHSKATASNSAHVNHSPTEARHTGVKTAKRAERQAGGLTGTEAECARTGRAGRSASLAVVPRQATAAAAAAGASRVVPAPRLLVDRRSIAREITTCF